MPLFVTYNSAYAPTYSQLAGKDYPVCFNTTYHKIYICKPNNTEVHEFNGNDTTNIRCYYNEDPDATNYISVTAGPYINLKHSAKISFNVEDEKNTIRIQHKNVDTAYTYSKIINKINTDSSGHVISMSYVDAGITNIIAISSLPSNPNTNTLYLIK